MDDPIGCALFALACIIVFAIIISSCVSDLADEKLDVFCEGAGYAGMQKINDIAYCWRMQGDDIFMRSVDKIKQGGE
jgi:hypothetical protein